MFVNMQKEDFTLFKLFGASPVVQNAHCEARAGESSGEQSTRNLPCLSHGCCDGMLSQTTKEPPTVHQV